ncbi:phage tail tape measure protein [Nocardioides aquiterrae]|uniref:Phage tail tape measure protein n=2 Tax=Nocardioides aquiterrae TaxID=203799 RepID=A0ABN1ULV9_9ACTN
MVDRSVVYRFVGDFKSLSAGLATAGRNVAELGTKMTALDRNGAKMRAGLTAVGSTAGKVGLVAAAGVGVFIASAARFDKSMSAVQAATHETAGNMEFLRAAAIKAGADTVYSATEAAGAIEELAKAGVSTQDILSGGLSGALSLAAAGGLEVADAAGIAAIAMQQFGLSGAQIPHVADLLAAGAGKAMGSVSDLGMALKQSGLVASQAGLSIEETTGALAAMASAGLLGSDAGTSLKQAILSLESPTTKAQGVLEQYGISIYDANGQMRSMTNIAGQLQAAFKGKSDAERNAALATIFGSDAIRVANVLYQQGAEGIQDWITKVNDQGAAAETAGKRLDNLAGDIEQLKGSLETMFIGTGEGAQGPLRKLTQGLTDNINAFNDLPGPAHDATLALAGLTAVLGGGVWTTGKVVSGISSTSEALTNLGVSSERAEKSSRLLFRGLGTAAGLGLFALGAENASTAVGALETALGGALTGFSLGGPWGAAIGGATGLLGGFATANRDAAANVDALTASLDQQTGALTENTRTTIANILEKEGSLKAARELGIGLDLITDATLGNAQAMAQLEQIHAAWVDSLHTGSQESKDAAYDQWGAWQTLLKGMGEGTHDLEEARAGQSRLSEATDKTTGSTKTYGVAARQSAQASKQEAAAVADATKAMEEKRSATLAAFDAETSYRQALKDATEQGKKSNAGIKGTTDEALANRAALSQLAAAWNNQSAAVRNNEQRFKAARQAFIQTAQAMGVSEAAAKSLADRVLEIPKSRVIETDVKTSKALSAIDRLKLSLAQVKSKDVEVRVHYTAIGNKMAALAASGAIPTPGHATGGYITGPGTKTSDSIPALLSNGEYVVRASAVDQYGIELFNALNAQKLAAGGIVSRDALTLAAGGTVTTLGPCAVPAELIGAAA